MTAGALPALCLLPGLDGTGQLYRRFIAHWGGRSPVTVIDYDSASFDGYAVLAATVAQRLPTQDFLLVAESFAGPLAIRLAAARPAGLRGVVLSATFAHAPLPLSGMLAMLLERVPAVLPPARLLEQVLAGGCTDAPLRGELDAALSRIPASVLQRRALATLRCDERAALASIDVPLLCIRPSRDRLIRRSASTDIVRTAQRAVRVDIDAPHFVFQTAPADCATAIAEFAARLS